MKYLSLFTGVGGFELGIERAYARKNRGMGCDTKTDVCLERTGPETGDSSGEHNPLSERPDGHSDGLPRPENTDNLKGHESTTRHELPIEDTSVRGDSSDSDELRQRREQDAICVGYSEIDKYAIQIYQHHFPNHKNYGDITKINEKELPDFDMLFGGFPCQSFSLMGKRGGFNDTRGTLFFEIARILQVKRPRICFLENVKGLLSHAGGHTFRTIVSTLDELGYDCQWELLNSKDFGVPQRRERVYIVGHLRGTGRPEVFPFGQPDKEAQEERIVSTTIDANYWKGIDNHGQRTAIAIIPEATKKGYAEAVPGQSINLSVMGSKTRRGRVSNVAQTIDTGMQQHTLTPEGMIRRLTPTECERLQGFPDGWTESVSDTQRYKMMGNAVTVNVIEAIMGKLINQQTGG